MKYGFALSVVLLLAGVAGFVIAEDAEKAPATAPSTQPVNQNCAVMNDEKADPEVTTVHEGRTIAFCCKECIATFEKDPEKYLKTMK
jgi:YHS domain-containing protein